MNAKDLIDGIRNALEAAGFKMKLNVGRDVIARTCYGMAYSPMIAAEREGKLDQPRIIEAGLDDVRARFGGDKADLVREVVAQRLSV